MTDAPPLGPLAPGLYARATMNPSRQSETPSLHVICLCASWCGVCRDFAATYHALVQTHSQVQFLWLDIEDEADLIDDMEVENFPTLLLGVDGQAVFHGPVLPHLPGLTRLVREAPLLPPLAAADSTHAAQQLLTRVLAARSHTAQA